MAAIAAVAAGVLGEYALEQATDPSNWETLINWMAGSKPKAAVRLLRKAARKAARNKPQFTPMPRRVRNGEQLLRVVAARGTQNAERYRAQILAPPSSNNERIPFPDGSQQPSIVVRYKQLYTILPDTAGTINLAMVPVPDGGLAIRNGAGWTATLPQFDVAPNRSVTAETAYTKAPGAANGLWYVMPFQELITTGAQGSKDFSAMKFQAYRYLAQAATLTFTGSTFEDQGSVAASRVNLSGTHDDQVTININGVACNPYALPNPLDTLTEHSAQSAVYFGSARESFTLNNASTTPIYQPVWASATGYFSTSGNVVSVASLSSTGTIQNGYLTGVDPFHPATFVTYSGLASSASISIELASTIEFALSPNSPLNGYINPNPPRDSALIDMLQSTARDIPVARKNGHSMWPGMQTSIRKNSKKI